MAFRVNRDFLLEVKCKGSPLEIAGTPSTVSHFTILVRQLKIVIHVRLIWAVEKGNSLVKISFTHRGQWTFLLIFTEGARIRTRMVYLECFIAIKHIFLIRRKITEFLILVSRKIALRLEVVVLPRLFSLPISRLHSVNK